MNENMIDSMMNQMNIIEKDIGVVISFMDGCAIVVGLFAVCIHEKVLLDNDLFGIVFDIFEDKVFIFVIGNLPLQVGSKVKRTKEQYGITVGSDMTGHIFDVLGNCIDGSVCIKKNEKKVFTEREVPGMITRETISQPLETGILAIDSLIPIGRGQRQLFIGNQNTGKTYAALSSFVRQKEDENVICIYVAVSQQKAKTLRLIEYLKQNDVFKNTIILSADAFEPALNHYLAPFVGCAIAEFFAHDLNKDVIIIYDDLSNHAIAYRELCLLMKRAPSREAYPSDVFYLHARLLERAGNFKDKGSITALPIAQLQEDDSSAYIATNLVSITDGQVVFDTKLFNKGFKPAINTELSVSRVGSAAQFPVISSVSKALRLKLAEYTELASFSQFSSDLDQDTLERLQKGKALIDILKQPLNVNYTVSQKYIILYIYEFYYNEMKKIDNLMMFFAWAFDFFQSTYKDVYELLEAGKILNSENMKEFNFFIIEIFTLYQAI